MKIFFSFLCMANISAAAKREALVELIINILFSALPIWFGALIYTCISFFPLDDKSWSIMTTHAWNGFVRNVSSGELLMYATATLGPTLYIGLSSFGGKDKPFPWVRPQLILAILLNLFATVLFFFSRDKGFASNETFIIFTAIIYSVCIILLFPSMAFVHDKNKFLTREAQTEDQDSFLAGYRHHRS